MKISIIIPVYNVGRWIRRCLLSVCQQTYNNIECIIVNDATPDNSMEIVAAVLNEYCGPIDFKVINHKKNKGLSTARNTGVNAATGQYLFFLDSDDSLYENTSIENGVSYIKHYGGKVDFVIGKCCVIGGAPLEETTDLFLENDAIIESYLRREWSVIACSKFINREFFLKNKLWFLSGVLHEDISFSFKLAITAHTMVSMNEFVYKYYVQENSITGRMKYKNYSDYLSLMHNNYSLVRHNPILDKSIVFSYFVTGLFGFIHHCINNPYLNKDEKKILFSQYKIEISQERFILTNRIKILIEYLLFRLPYCVSSFILKLV